MKYSQTIFSILVMELLNEDRREIFKRFHEILPSVIIPLYSQFVK